MTHQKIEKAIELSRQHMLVKALEWEFWYANERGWTVLHLRNQGRIVVPCFDHPRCEHPDCKGWNSIPGDLLRDYKAMGKVPNWWTWPPGKSSANPWESFYREAAEQVIILSKGIDLTNGEVFTVNVEWTEE